MILCDCGKEYNNDFDFCPYCGRPKDLDLDNYSQLPKEYKKAYGTWQISKLRGINRRNMVVSTIGIFEGYLDDIVLSLRKECDDYLIVEGVTIQKIGSCEDLGAKVNIMFSTLVDGRHIGVETTKKILCDRDVKIKKVGNKGVLQIKRVSESSGVSSLLGIKN